MEMSAGDDPIRGCQQGVAVNYKQRLQFKDVTCHR